jgi:tRNA G26 N,N-dimethylase Trm1
MSDFIATYNRSQMLRTLQNQLAIVIQEYLRLACAIKGHEIEEKYSLEGLVLTYCCKRCGEVAETLIGREEIKQGLMRMKDDFFSYD